MNSARDFLAAVQQRADDPRAKYHHKPCSAPVCGSRHCQTARDRDALLAALTAALDVVDRIDAIDDELAHRPTIVRHLRAAITDALTHQEDS